MSQQLFCDSDYFVLNRTEIRRIILKEECNGNRKFSCFWCEMKDFVVSTKCNHFDKKFQLLFEILSFEKPTDFRSKKYFLTSGKATML